MIKNLILINFLKKIINMKIIIIKELTHKKIRLTAKARLLSSNLFFKGINLLTQKYLVIAHKKIFFLCFK